MSKGKELSQFANKVEYDDGTNKIRVDAIQVPQNIFKTIAVAGQSNVEADTTSDTLTLVAGTNMTLTTDAGTDTITLASSGSGGTQNLFSTVAVSGQNDIVADSTTDTLTLAAGAGITLTTDQATDTLTITSSAGGGSLSNIVEDTSPQLGGDLDLNSNNITGTGNIPAANLTGTLPAISGANLTSVTASSVQVTESSDDNVSYNILFSDTDGSGNVQMTPTQDDNALTFNPFTNLLTTGSITLGGTLNSHSIPTGTGTLALTSDIPAAYTDASVDTHLNTSTASSSEVLSWTGSDYDWVAQSGGGSALTVQEEGVSLATDADTLNFVGSNITATGTGGTKTITVAANAPGGSDTYVQFNDGGTLSGDAGMTYNKTTDVLTVGSITSTAAGTPTLTSSSAINLSVGSSVVIQQNSGGGGFRVGNLTTTNRNALTAANGEVIYNTTDNKFQVYENGAWANIISTGGIASVVADTTPELGGNLDVNGKDIVSSSNGDIEIKPNGSGDIHLETTTGMVRVTHPNPAGTGIDLGSHNMYLNSDSTSTGTSVSIGFQPGTDTGTTTNTYSFLKTTRTSNTSADFSINVANESSPAGSYYVTTYYGNDQSGRVDFPGNVKLKADGTNYASAKVGTANVFNITAPNAPNHYTFNDPDSHWFPTAEDDPTLYLRRGETYYFVINASGHPFEIRNQSGGTAWTEGITNNTQATGTIIFKVPMSISDTSLAYQCTSHSNMEGSISII